MYNIQSVCKETILALSLDRLDLSLHKTKIAMKGLGGFASSNKKQKDHIWLNLSISSILWLCEMCSSQYCDSLNSFSWKVDLIAFFPDMLYL